MGTWKSKNRHKYLLQYHIIFVCKYRKKLLISKQISDDIKQFSYEICQRHNVIIRYMETDKDHIHFLAGYDPTDRVCDMVKIIKQETTYYLWKKHNRFLSRQYWKKKIFWSDGYFACSIGEVSSATIQKYIETQD
jgi:putative transposase